ncbi:zinc ribbon domain-containing protein [uncultured Zobellia sp.]|uniref:double zinc ribbon domain-containing protein n=1 Tax=uncultured Zobellia sp. TaxID=255433 RepID=UPI002598E452|nr:zinc ribbon domain-containing protein [uncultured Zobellia sp.]
MKNCPNCNDSIKKTYKFCPNCKINFASYKLIEKPSIKIDKKAIKYCSNCGNRMEVTHKFCVECGNSAPEKKTDNKIDNSLNRAKDTFSNISKEFSESETVNSISQNAKKIAKETSKKAKHTGNKFLFFLGILGSLALIIVIINPIITPNRFVIYSAYETYLEGSKNGYAGFIGQVSGTIILPLILIYAGFRKYKSFIGFVFWPIVVALIIITIDIVS